MTDNEMIEVLSNDVATRYSYFVCFNEGKRPCIVRTVDILDLINRQKSEIERLTINMNAFGLGMIRVKEKADTVTAEAIKEFAERLKKISGSCVAVDGERELYGTKTYTFKATELDNLVKEMVGESE